MTTADRLAALEIFLRPPTPTRRPPREALAEVFSILNAIADRARAGGSPDAFSWLPARREELDALPAGDADEFAPLVLRQMRAVVYRHAELKEPTQ